MVKYSVILVEPKTTGNIGAVCRLIHNFGLKDLYLINPPELDDDAYARAMHAKDLLEEAEVYENLEECLNEFDLLVGTSGIHTQKEKKFLRKAETPENLAESTKNFDGKVGLMFGREDQGLSNEELKNCDRLVRIPTSEDYPIMNLSHAVCVILYEIFKENEDFDLVPEDKISSQGDKDRLNEYFTEILDMIDYPDHKKEKTEIMFRKIIGRAMITKWEYHRLMGVFSQIKKNL